MNNWNTGTVVTPECTSCPAKPGAGDDVAIGNFYVDVDAANPIKSLVTTTLLRITSVLDVSDIATYNGPVVGRGSVGGTGEHFFLDTVTPDTGSSYFSVNVPTTATFSGGLNIGAGAGLGVYSTAYNTDTVTWAGDTIIIDGAYGGGENAVIRNQPGATFLATADGEIRGIIGLGHFDNYGTFRKQGGLGTTAVGSEFKNRAGGLLDVVTGKVSLNGDCTLGGTAKIAGNSKLEIRGYATVSSAFSSTGAGTFRLSNRLIVNQGATASFVHFDMGLTAGETGYRQGLGTIQISGTAVFGGTLESGITNLQAGSIGQTNYDLFLHLGAVLNNAGTLTTSSTTIGIGENGSVNNLAGGVFDCTGAGVISGYGFTTGSMSNAGTFRKSGGDTTLVALPFTNTGTVAANSGELEFTGFHQTSGQTILGGGSLYGFDQVLSFEGGSLKGNGNIRGKVLNDGATVSPGNSAGLLTIGGGYYGNYYTQTATGTLEIEIGGTAAGTQYDQLVVGRPGDFNVIATLDGKLKVKYINGFNPTTGSFDVLVAQHRSGQFSNLDLPPNMAVEYLPDGVRLIVGTACPADINDDGFVDDADFTLFVGAYNLLICEDPAMPPGCPADFNLDELVDDADFVIFVVAYNELLCP